MVTALGVMSREKRICYGRRGKHPLVRSLEESEHPLSLSPYEADEADEADGGPSCDLRVRGPCRCGRHSPAQTRAVSIHPADPPIASQSFTRDVRFPKRAPPHPCSLQGSLF